MAVSIAIDVTLNSQNITNNTSNVTVKVNAKWTGGSFNLLEKSGSCTIDGTKYTFTSPFNTGQTTSGSSNLFTKTLNITHGSDGKKTLAVSASYTSGVSSGTVSASASVPLTTIPRKSTLSVANGTLGTAQTLTITRQTTSFSHSIKAVCGSSTLYIKADGSTQTTESIHTDSSIPFTPPLSWASQNTSGTSVSVTYTITTYTTGPAKVASVSYTVQYSIPSSVVPSCSISVTDPTGYKDTYGAYIQGLSQFAVVVKATTAYGSPIDSYKVTADGVNYTSSSFTTNVIRSSAGLKKITAYVTDKRGRTSNLQSANVNIIAYTPPAIDFLKAERYNINHQPDPKGELIHVDFGATVTALNNLNTATYTLQYKKTTDDEYTNYDLSRLNNNYSVSAGQAMFNADTGSSYEIILTVTDAFGVEKQAKQKDFVSSAAAFMSWRKDYKGLALNKIAEEDDLFDVGWASRFNEPVCGNVEGLNKLPHIPNGADLNDYKQTGCWAIYSNSSDNQPSRADMIYCGGKLLGSDDTVPPARAGRLIVYAATGEGIRETQWSYLRQRFIPYNMDNAVFERDIARGQDNLWHYYEWWKSSLTPDASEMVYSILAKGTKAAMTIALTANSVLGKVNTYTKIPFDKSVLSTNERLTLSSNAIRIGAGIQHIKVNGQVLVSPGSTDGLRHVRIQKVSGATTTSVAWSTLYFTGSRHLAHVMTPLIVSVKEGDLLQMVFYTGNANDSISSGTAANGWQTYLTVEEL